MNRRFEIRDRLHEQGFTLLEVLVALLVLSIGLLGLALLQTTSLRLNTESYSRTQATLLAYDIIDRMRANPAGRASGAYDVAEAAANTKISTYQGCKTAGCNCDSTACDAGNLALYDLGQWYQTQDTWLRGAGAGSGKRSEITRSGNTMTIVIRWMEQDLLQQQRWVVDL